MTALDLSTHFTDNVLWILLEKDPDLPTVIQPFGGRARYQQRTSLPFSFHHIPFGGIFLNTLM